VFLTVYWHSSHVCLTVCWQFFYACLTVYWQSLYVYFTLYWITWGVPHRVLTIVSCVPDHMLTIFSCVPHLILTLFMCASPYTNTSFRVFPHPIHTRHVLYHCALQVAFHLALVVSSNTVQFLIEVFSCFQCVKRYTFLMLFQVFSV
jgi:hypothetical protein